MMTLKTNSNLNSKYGITEVFVKHDYYASLRVKLIKEYNGKFILLKDNGDELIELGEVETTKKIYTAPKGFLSIELDFELKYFYEEGEYSIPRYKYILHRGSSRSSKSWSIEEWIIRECETKPNCRISVWRDTRQSLHETVWADFKKIFALSGREYQFTRNTVPIYFDNTKSTIIPSGADTTNAHGFLQDIAWLNEPYNVGKDTFDQIDMRSTQIIIDMNPKEAHWSDTVAKSPRCKVIHSTFKNNPFCPPEQKKKILSYDPENPINVKNGTADLYMHQVYALGMKAEKPNKVHHNWKTIKRLEFDKLPYTSYYGLDFGTVHPTVLTEVKYNDGNFYVCELLYKPMSNGELQKDGFNSLIDYLEKLGIKKGSDMIICDSAGKSEIMELKMAGFYAIPAEKGPGSVISGINFEQRANIHLTDDSENGWNEYDSYEFEIDRYGFPTDKPIKRNDDFMDSKRYVIMFLQKYLYITI